MINNDEVSEKEVEMIRYIQENQTEMNKFFKDMKFKSKDFQQNNNENTKDKNLQTKSKKQPVNVNYRGEKVFSVQDLRKNYQNAIFGTKWWQLPYGRRNILGKIQFWLGASFIFTYMYSSYYIRKMKVDRLGYKFYRNFLLCIHLLRVYCSSPIVILTLIIIGQVIIQCWQGIQRKNCIKLMERNEQLNQ